jgi:hypothetical protein
VLNPNAWTAVPNGQFAANQSSIRYYRGFRYPMENANFGRNFRLREKATLRLRVDWTNMFNRLELPQPTTTGYTAAPTLYGRLWNRGSDRGQRHHRDAKRSGHRAHHVLSASRSLLNVAY